MQLLLVLSKKGPTKYYKGLDKKKKKKREKEFTKRKKEARDGIETNEPLETDKGVKTKESKHTKAYKKQFGSESAGKIKGLEKKAKETGISYSILKQVYDRGMAAWRTGHRPGASQHQWAFARVNSFCTGGKTQKTADADLWAKVKKK
jgi:hypothetical protein